MKIEQIYFDNQLRNYSYLIRFKSGKTICIDPFEGSLVASKLQTNEKLDLIINTHDHCDHHEGNEYLRERYNCQILAHETSIIENLTIKAKDHQIVHQEDEWCLKVVYTPGHTLNHICLLLLQNNNEYAIFTGDCYFYAGVGNCYNGGDVNLLFESIKKYFVNASDDLIIYPGHEYLKRNLEFTLSIEQKNIDAQKILDAINDGKIKTIGHQHQLRDEKKINMFLRLSNPEIKENLQMKNGEEKAIFFKLRELRNNW